MITPAERADVSPRKGASTPGDRQAGPVRPSDPPGPRAAEGTRRGPAATASSKAKQEVDRNRLTIPPIWFV